MRFPQVSDRVKEAPAQALRGVFAGIGQLLLFTDKLRNKPPTQQWKPKISAPQPVAEPPAQTPDITAADLPLPNYDELSIASLRARLRNLDIAQLRQLTRYEQAHAARAEVIAMYERRVAKLEGERASADGAAAAQAQIAARAEVEDEVRAELEAEGNS